WVDAATEGLPVTWRSVLADTIAQPKILTDDINNALAAIEWPQIEVASGWSARFTRRAKAAHAGRVVLAVGREVVRRVVGPLVVEPTEMIHQAYRALDELTELGE